VLPEEQEVQDYYLFENKSRNRKTFSPDAENYFRGTSIGENLGNADLQYSLLLLCNALEALTSQEIAHF
jgi:hypothetical protein